MKRFLLTAILFLIAGLSFAQNKSEGSLDLLNQNISKKDSFDEIRLKRIGALEETLKDNLSAIESMINMHYFTMNTNQLTTIKHSILS